MSMINLSLFGIKSSFDGFNFVKKAILGGEYVLILSTHQNLVRKFPTQQLRDEAFDAIATQMTEDNLNPVVFSSWLINVQAIDSMQLRDNLVCICYPHGASLNIICGSIDIATKLYNDISDASGSMGGDSVKSVNGKTGIVTINKTDVGLSNVDNTSDADKPISTATKEALNLKADKETTYTKNEVNQLVDTIKQFTVSIVDALPDTGEEYVIYFVAKTGEVSDVYDEYMWISGKWEKIGTTAIDLSDYLTKTEAAENYATKAQGDKADTAVQPQQLTEELATKADKATTLSGYGITDAYTKTEIDVMIGNVEQALSEV